MVPTTLVPKQNGGKVNWNDVRVLNDDNFYLLTSPEKTNALSLEDESFLTRVWQSLLNISDYKAVPKRNHRANSLDPGWDPGRYDTHVVLKQSEMMQPHQQVGVLQDVAELLHGCVCVRLTECTHVFGSDWARFTLVQWFHNAAAVKLIKLVCVCVSQQ